MWTILIGTSEFFLTPARIGKDGAQAKAFLRSAIALRRESLAKFPKKIGQKRTGISLADQYISLRAGATGAMFRVELNAVDSMLAGLGDEILGVKRAEAGQESPTHPD